MASKSDVDKIINSFTGEQEGVATAIGTVRGCVQIAAAILKETVPDGNRDASAVVDLAREILSEIRAAAHRAAGVPTVDMKG